MIDISAVGAKVQITGLGFDTIEINQFSDEGTPFECPDVDLSTNKKNLNGEMISSRTPSIYTVAITVIPGSKADRALTKLASMSALQKGSVTAISQIEISNIILIVPAWKGSGENAKNVHTYKWAYGRMKSGPTGPSTNADGRMRARTFKFEMQNFTPPSDKNWGDDNQ